jgi:uncharacterized membrane protein
MSLPEITLPKIELPFDIPVLLHPPVDHFAIALPVVVLLLELINLVAKKRALSVLSLFFIVLTVVAVFAAYLTGSVDGKETFSMLSEAGQAELKEHKLLGTYLLLASGLLLIVKLLSMLFSKALAQLVYLLLLVLFVIGILYQGNEGGELVYEHGANVEKVKMLDDKIFDIEEALDEVKEAIKEAAPETEVPEEDDAEAAPTETVEEADEAVAPEAAQEGDTPAEPLKPELKEEELPAEKEKREVLEVEGMPEEMVQPEIATH